MASFWKNASIMAVAELFLKLKGLIVMPFITKYLGAINYGIWSQVMVIVSLLSPLVFCGMDNSLMRFLPGQVIERQRRDFTGWFLFGLIASIVFFVLVSLFNHQLSELFFGGGKEYANFVILAGLNIVTTSLLTGIRNWFRIQNNAWSLVTITIMQNILQMIVLVVVLLKSQGIYELVLWSLVVDGVLIGFYFVYMLRTKVFTKPSLAWLKPYFRFGIVLLPSGYAVWVLNSLDRVFLAHYHTLSDIGVYSICFTLGYTLIQVIVNPIWSLFPTRAAELYNVKNYIELNELFNQSIKLICWLIFPCVAGLVIVGDALLKILTTTEFEKGAIVVPIILSGYLFSMLSSYFECVLVLKNKPYLSTYFTVISCITNIALNFLLIPKHSYLGAAVATTLSFFLQLTMSSFYARKESLVTLNVKVLLNILFASMIMLLSMCILKYYILQFSHFLTILILFFCGAAVYLYFSIVFKIYKFLDIIAIFYQRVARV